jgi:ribosome biogenesis SPOUT family RNA methylase Rps3|tara:strand:+ start:1309 stop:1863 length:555 start_codon:yes stop_codon:yes gene_type:complete
MKYIIEHLEPELFPWCIIEYRHITKILGKANVLFTNIRRKKDCDRIRGFAKAIKESFTTLDLNRVCVLDPAASNVLSSSDATSFDVIVLGGILGDYPMKARTKEEIPSGYERRHLGKEQMPTDNAAFVAKGILSGKKMSDFSFKDGITVELDEGEATDLPFRYVMIEGKPLMSGQLVELLKKGF